MNRTIVTLGGIGALAWGSHLVVSPLLALTLALAPADRGSAPARATPAVVTGAARDSLAVDTGATTPRSDTLMLDVGGHRLRMVVAGRGTPTVVLEAGLGGGIGDWDEVLPGIARFTRVVAYDRAGYGGSDSVTGPRTARRVAAELHEALARADVRPPYVLVGHSLGGAFVRVYAATYPGDVAGLVLVDPAMEEFYRRAAELPEWKAVQAEHERRIAHASAAERGEWLAWDSTMAQLRAAHPLPTVPIIMLTAAGSRDGRGGELLRMWDEVQAKWVGRTSGARQIVATKSGHCIQCDEPELVIDAIRTVTGRGAHAAASASDTSIALTHVAVVDVEHGRVLRDRTVLIGGNRIRRVGPSTRVRVPPGARVVDASGKFLIPGLWDMHVHALRAGRAEWMFPLFIAAGVTGIRDTGSPLDTLLLYEARVGEGRMLGPRIVGAGSLLDAPPGEVPVLTLPVGSPAAGRHAVDSLADAGVDFIKVYNGLSRESFLAIVAEAKRRGVRVIGHVPRSVGALEASAAGLASIEHLTRVPQVCVPDSVNRSTTREWEMGSKRPGMTQDALDSLGFELSARRTAAFDEALCEQAGERFARNGTWQVPTLELNLHWARGFLDSDTAGTDTLLRYVPAPVRAVWDHYRDSTRALPRLPGDVEASWYRLLSRVIRALHRGGDGILAGTDTDGNDANIYGVPGVALHRELEALVRDAGLAPLEALRAATLEPARFLHATDSLGTVAPGKLADLVLLDANPLADIRNARRVVAVVANGRYLDRQMLDAMLEARRRGSDAAPRGGQEVASPAYTFPPEYAHQDAIWLGWSEEQRHHPVQVEMIRALLPHVAVRVMVRSDSARAEAERMLATAGIDTGRIGFVEHPLATNWIRDSGPRFVSDGRRLAVADFAWNGYGYPAEIRATFGKGALGRGAIDNDIAARLKLPVVSSSIVAEGGALDVSRDVILAYRQTAMERNPGMPIDEIEREYLRVYGKRKVVWLTRAPLSDRVFSGPKIANYFGWGANGHIDEFVRFVDDSTIVIAQIDSADASTNPLSAADREILRENLAELRAAVNVDGHPFHIVTLPVPGIQHYMWTGPLSEEDKRADAMGAWYRGVAVGDTIHWVPAVSYVNFVITNGVVLAAAYWHEGLPERERKKDELVRATLERLFPDRRIVQIDPLAINWSGGGMHCSTQQQPSVAGPDLQTTVSVGHR